MSKENDIKLLEQLKSGFKRTIKWNKYRSQMTIQPKNNNLNYLIDPTFMNVNRFFFFFFFCLFQEIIRLKTEILFQIIMYQRLESMTFFNLSVKNEEEAYEKNMDMSNNNDYTTGNLLDFAYYKENYRLIAIDLSKQTKLKDPQQISFIGKLDKDNGATMFFIIEKSEEITLNFSQNSVTII